MSAARVLVVDDEPAVLRIVSSILRYKGYEVLPTSSPRQALEIVKNDPPINLIVSDIGMPEMSGAELVREVARISPQTAPVLMTGGIVEPGQVPVGVPVLRKPLSTENLLSACQAALERSASLSTQLARAREKCDELRREGNRLRSECGAAVQRSAELIQRSHAVKAYCQKTDQQATGWTESPDEAESPHALTPREIEVLQLIASGLSGKEIAAQLGVSLKTAASHREHIMNKLCIRNAVGLLRYAVRNKLIEP
jgi:DNA-binding NarL/FixJ family response regulator